jgi:hypothetical protein
LGYNTDAINKNTETLFDVIKLAGLEINVGKPKYMLVSPHQNADQNWAIKIANRLFRNVPQFIYLGRTIRNQNLIQEEIKIRWNNSNT